VKSDVLGFQVSVIDSLQTQFMVGTENLFYDFAGLILWDNSSRFDKRFQVTATVLQKKEVFFFSWLTLVAIKLHDVLRIHFLVQI
jgi:hypothetical protein